MFEIAEQVKLADRRPGFSIVSFVEVGLPVWMVWPLVTLESTQGVGAIEEFILRSINAGVDSVPELSRFLGLDQMLIRKQVGGLLYEDVLAVGAKKDTFKIGRAGIDRINDLEQKQIEKAILPFYIDGITRDPLPIDSRDLFRAKELESEGLTPLAPIPRRPPRVNEISIQGVNRVLRARGQTGDEKKRVIRLEAYANRTHVFFRRAVAVAFKSESGRKISVGFLVNGTLSEDHEKAVMGLDEQRRPRLFDDIFDGTKRRRGVQEAARNLSKEVPELGAMSAKMKGGSARGTLTLDWGDRREARIEYDGSESVETLSVYDHPPLLRNALENAKNRIVIISPWIRANVVDDEFVALLEKTLTKGVSVRIEYGLGKDDKRASDKDLAAVNRLSELVKDYPNFVFNRKGNTHAKVLLVDEEFFVTTSFNWLSFRGDPNQPFREEEGTLVRGAALVNRYFERLVGT